MILGYAPLSNTTGTDLYLTGLSVDFVAGQGNVDPIDAADNYEYGFGFFSTISANNSLNTAGFLGLYLAPVGFLGPVTLSFDISTSPDFMNNGPDYVATDSFTYPAVAVPEPAKALIASEGYRAVVVHHSQEDQEEDLAVVCGRSVYSEFVGPDPNLMNSG